MKTQTANFKTFTLGQKVAVHIAGPAHFVADLPPAMNGQTGVIERVSDGPSFNGYKINDPTYLIRFDAPLNIPGSWNDGLEAFWLDGLDLTEVN